MDKWEMNLGSWNIHEVWKAVADKEWQTFRLSLKGVPTGKKLERLQDYLNGQLVEEGVDDYQQLSWQVRCRVQNYIGALKRGGQLSISGRVQR